MTTDEFCDLVAGISEKWICNYLEINPKTVKRWKLGVTKPPHATALLLKIKLDGDLSAIGNEGWKGFKIGIKDHLLYMPLFHGGYTPEKLQAMFFLNQRARWYEREMHKLERENKALKEKAVLQKGERERPTVKSWTIEEVRLISHAG